jgi:hypothetical protein
MGAEAGTLQTVLMNASPQPGRLVCACGKTTDQICFFADGDPHGVCERCASVHLLELETGQTVPRLVCDRCWERRRAKAR